jgi:hypothetical protein
MFEIKDDKSHTSSKIDNAFERHVKQLYEQGE